MEIEKLFYRSARRSLCRDSHRAFACEHRGPRVSKRDLMTGLQVVALCI
jgi:hypothetical protein